MIVDLADGSSMVCSKVEFCLDGYNVDNYRFFHIGEICRVKDVREVKRGRWIKAKGNWVTPGGDPVWECSECGKGRHVYGIEHGTYGAAVADGQWVSCPNCGAEMREAEA